MRETITDLLDALAVLLLAAGLGCTAAGWTTVIIKGSYGFNTAMAGLGMTVAGAVVFTGSMLASRPPRSSRNGVDQ